VCWDCRGMCMYSRALGEGRAGQGRAGQRGRTGQGRTGQGRTGQGRSTGQDRTGQDRAGQGHLSLCARRWPLWSIRYSSHNLIGTQTMVGCVALSPFSPGRIDLLHALYICISRTVHPHIHGVAGSVYQYCREHHIIITAYGSIDSVLSNTGVCVRMWVV